MSFRTNLNADSARLRGRNPESTFESVFLLKQGHEARVQLDWFELLEQTPLYSAASSSEENMACFHPSYPPEDCIHCDHRQLRAFCNLTPEALADYDRLGIMVSHERGDKLFSEGDPARNVHVICYGQVKISSMSRDGKIMILKIAGPGDLMGLSAALANVPYEVTAEAVEPCQLKVVRRQEFIDFLNRHGIASMNAAHSLSNEYMSVFYDAKRLALSGSAAGRLARLLLDWGHAAANGKPEIKFTMALTHEELASMAGTSRETMTRLLNRFRRDQWITIKGSSVTILKPEQLERLTA
jgi:CRP/FNR family cyclic AMP-dependent transcriptional regulator